MPVIVDVRPEVAAAARSAAACAHRDSEQNGEEPDHDVSRPVRVALVRCDRSRSLIGHRRSLLFVYSRRT
jgi:hypothetical protein